MSLTNSNKKSKQPTQGDTVTFAHVLSYKLLNKHVQFLYPRLDKLENTIKEAMLPVPFDVYVCTMVFVSLIASVLGLIGGIILSVVVNIEPSVFKFFFPVLGFIGGGTMAFGMMNILPSLRVKNRASKLTEELPHFIGYMATLATSGLSLEGIFKAIASEDTDEEIVRDCRFITRNIEILGMDLLSAITDLIKRTPKGPYSELLEGAIITVQTGGNLKDYFIAQAKVQLEEKKMSMRKSTESLGVMAEMYTTLLIVFPLLAIIMLSVMAIMSPDLAGFDLITLMNMLTYVMVPFFGIMLLFMMDSMVPKR